MDKDKVIQELIQIRRELSNLYDEKKEINKKIKEKKELEDNLFRILENED